MSNKLNENYVSQNILDLIDPKDKLQLEEFSNFIKCNKCSEVSSDPKACYTCNYITCQSKSCYTNKCNHPLSISRHIRDLLKDLKLKCRFKFKGCTKEGTISEIRNHILECKFAELKLVQLSKYNEIYNLSNQKLNLIKKNASNNEKLNKSALGKNLSLNKYQLKDNSITQDCLKCRTKLNNKREYVEHLKICTMNSDDNIADINFQEIQPENDINSSIITGCAVGVHDISNDNISDFNRLITNSNIEVLKNNLNYKLINLKKEQKDYISNIITTNGKEIDFTLSQFIKELNAKKEQKEALDISNTKYKNENFFEEDQQLNLIKQEFETLQNQKIELLNKLKKKIDEIRNIEFQQEKNLEADLQSSKKVWLQLQLEESWLNDEIESSEFEANGEKCAKCREEDNSVKKFFCQECRGKYCIGKCAVQCSNSRVCGNNLEKINLCPKCSKPCDLCRMVIYCETCLKKCFYENCNNKFCPECFKRNEHQTRNPKVNCKFFTCEKDKICDCLMTSLFCTKCDKRHCNNCIHENKDHFPGINFK